MRQIGLLANSKDAARFASYLVTQGIAAQSEEENGQWAVWVRDEDHLDAARSALAEFKADPSQAKFRGVEQVAEQRLREEASKREAARQNVVPMGQRWRGPGGGRRRPLTLIVLLVCTVIGVMTNFGDDKNSSILEALRFAKYDHFAAGDPQGLSEKLVDIRRGEVWRFVTPALIHFNTFHIAFNLVMFYQIASALEHRQGTWRLAWLMLAIAIPSNLAQALVPNEWGGTVYFGGLSGVVFGLLGYVWMKSRFDPAAGLYINRGTLLMAVIFLVLGIAGTFNSGNIRIANWAHTVGFAAGIVIGYAPIAWRSIDRNQDLPPTT